MTLVIADGFILTVNDTTNIELFWAIRGGGCNFGVVTKFVYQLHPQRRNVNAGQLIFPASVFEKLIQVTTEWWANGQGPSEKEAMMQLLTRGSQCEVIHRFIEPKSDRIFPEFSLRSLASLRLWFRGRKGQVQMFL